MIRAKSLGYKLLETKLQKERELLTNRTNEMNTKRLEMILSKLINWFVYTSVSLA